MRTELIGFGTALPAGSLTQDEAVGAAVRLSGLDPLALGNFPHDRNIWRNGACLICTSSPQDSPRPNLKNCSQRTSCM